MLSTCAALMQKAHDEGKSQEDCIKAGLAYLNELRGNQVDFGMSDIYKIAHKLFQTYPIG